MGEKKVRAVAAGFSCMDVYEKLNRCYPTGNGVDWGVHLQRLGISVSVVSVTGTDEYGKNNAQNAAAGRNRDLTFT